MDEKTAGHGCGGFHHGGENEYCCSKHQPMQRFMETCLLALLAEHESHGYELAEQLKNYGFEDINASTLYRIMRKMDERSWVSSSWKESGKGPKRRVYHITEEGRCTLDEWIEVFRRRRESIDLLLSKYNKLNTEE